MLLASCSYEESKKYSSKIVLSSEDDNSKKAEEVLLNIVTDNPNEVIVGGIGVAKCVTTRVSPTFCPVELHGNIFRLYELEEDLESILEEVEGVVPMLVLPEGYSDMRELCNIAAKYPNLRFIGGNLLEIPGLKIGRYDKGKEKMSSVFNGVYDIFQEIKLEDIEVQKVMSKVRSKSPKAKSTSSSKPKKVSSKDRQAETFLKFFGSADNPF
jgi:hypothetical protein